MKTCHDCNKATNNTRCRPCYRKYQKVRSLQHKQLSEAPGALEISDENIQRIEDLDSDIIEQFKVMQCCRLLCKSHFTGNERVEYVLCANGEARWWHMFPEHCKKI